MRETIPVFNGGDQTPSMLPSPEQPTFPYRVNMLAEQPKPKLLNELPTTTDVSFELHDLLEHRNNIRIVRSMELIEPEDQALLVKAPVELRTDHPTHTDYLSAENTALQRALPSALWDEYAPDIFRIPDQVREQASNINQAVRFEVGGKTINLYNLSDTILTGEDIGLIIADPLREMCDASGASIMDMVDVMVIASVNDDQMKVRTRDGGEAPVFAYAARGVMALSEYLFDQDLPLPGGGASEAATGDVELTGKALARAAVWHELNHLYAENGQAENQTMLEHYGKAVGLDAVGQKTNRFEEHPVPNGRQNIDEDLAITAEVLSADPEVAQQISPARRRGLQMVQSARRSSMQGPMFVTATEFNPADISGHLGITSQDHLTVVPDFGY